MMKKMTRRLVSLGAVVTLFGGTGAAQTTPGAAGHWEGNLHMGARDLGVTVDLARNTSGAWIGSMSVPGSTSIDVPLGNLTVVGTSVRFTASLPAQASFEGTLSADGNGLAGSASNPQGSIAFELTRRGEANVKVPPRSSALPKEFEGTWEGAIDAGGRVNRVGLRLSRAADGTAIGALIDIAGGNVEIPFTTVTIQGNELRAESRSLSATYHGTLGASGELTGEWSQGPTHIPLNLKRAPSEAKKP